MNCHSPRLVQVALVSLFAVGGPLPVLASAGAAQGLPLTFEANRGQVDAGVRYLARGAGYGLYLGADQVQLDLAAADANSAGASLRTRLLGADAGAQAVGEDALPGSSNYLLGADRSRWITGVPQFAAVRYRQVYRGIDLVYYGADRQLEYDFRLASGADPAQIRLQFDGARALKLDGDGNLVMTTAVGQLVQHRPRAWQERDGKQVPVDARFRLKGRRLSFELAAYDHSRPLVIDPLLSFHLYLPALQHEFANASTIDSAGNVYVTGYSVPYNPINNSLVNRFVNHDVFVTKLDPTGTKILYSAYIGGSKNEEANAIKVDSAGNAYVAGTTQSNDYPVTANAAQPLKAGYRDGFVTKLGANGKTILYSTFLGGVADDYLTGLALSADGSVTVVGSTSSIDFPTTAGALQHISGGKTDAFVTRIGADGAFVYSTYLGGSDDDGAAGVAVDAAGRAYVTGFAYSFNFPVSAGAFQPARSPVRVYSCGSNTCTDSPADAFVAVLTAAGDALSYGTYLGGQSGPDAGYAIAVDAAGSDVAVTGATYSSDFPLLHPLQGALRGGEDAFVAKLSGTPGALTLAWSTFLGGSAYTYYYGDFPTAIAIDGAGYTYVAGYTASTDFPTRVPYQRANSGSADGFLTKFKPDGSDLVYSTYLGGSGADFANGLSIDANGGVYVTGYTYSKTFTTTTAPVQGASFGLGDPFVVKFAADGASLAYATYFGETNDSVNLGIGGQNGDQTGLTVDLPIPLRGVVGCTLRAVDGGLIANTNILFPNHVTCGSEQPAP